MPVVSDNSEFSNINYYSHWITEKLRYCDTDRQGHINNSVFVIFLECGRVSILYDPESPLISDGYSFVIAHLSIDFLWEMNWPGEAGIGTRIIRLGKSSVTFAQGIFVNDKCVATAKTVIVLMNEKTRKSEPLPAKAIEKLKTYSSNA
jgi:acyl-CoA thioester hydrolase